MAAQPKQTKLQLSELDTLKQQDYDIVHCETIYFAPYLHTIRKNSKAKIVFRSHNVSNRRSMP